MKTDVNPEEKKSSFDKRNQGVCRNEPLTSTRLLYHVLIYDSIIKDIANQSSGSVKVKRKGKREQGKNKTAYQRQRKRRSC